jgi:hypothetical protein
MTLKVTLDTNLLFDLWRQRAGLAYVQRLIALADSGDIDLAVTRYVRDEVRLPPDAEEINRLPQVGITDTGGVFQLDVSRLDDPTDRLGDQRISDLEASVRTGPGSRAIPQPNDWLHLHGHRAHGRDVFLTNDKAILGLRGQLQECSVFVMTPGDLLGPLPT